MTSEERDGEQAGQESADQGPERVRRELERGRAIARARQAAAEAAAKAAAAEIAEAEEAGRSAGSVPREGGAEGQPSSGAWEGPAAAAGGHADRTSADDSAGRYGVMPHGAGQPGAGQTGGGAQHGAGRRSEAAEQARRAVRRTGQRPGRAINASEGADTEGARSAETGHEADEKGPGQGPGARPGTGGAASGGDAERSGEREGRSAGAEQARQALKRAGREARHARQQDAHQREAVKQSAEEAERSTEKDTGTGAKAGKGDGENGERPESSGRQRSEAAERARQAVVRTGQRKPPAVRAGEQQARTQSPAGTEGAGREGVRAVPGDARSGQRAARPVADRRAPRGPARVGDALESARTAEDAAGSTARGSKTAGRRVAGRARVFPALAVAEAAGGAADGEASVETGAAGTWWGRAWLDALETSALDPVRLARGRAYADEGRVGRITVAPGRISAPVTGSRPYPYRAEVRLLPFTDDQWEAFLDGVAARPAHLAALLGRTVPRALAERRGAAGVRLLPGPGDLAPRCSCPDRGYPCKHAAALCFQAARLLDADPFVLLLLRGRGEQELLDDLARRNATHTAHTAREARAALPGIPARAALQTRDLPPLPPPLPVPDHTGRPPLLPSAEDPAIDPAAIELLAADAAARARACLTEARAATTPPQGTRTAAAPSPRPTAAAARRDSDDPTVADTPFSTGAACGTGASLPTATPFPAATLWEDAIRLVAGAHPTSGLTASTREIYRGVAEATARTANDVARAVAAWRQGGAEGLSLLETTWDPPAGDFDRARSALVAADLTSLRPRHNHLTDADRGIQLRFGHDGRWYPYESDPGAEDWWPTGRADADPVGALTPLLATE